VRSRETWRQDTPDASGAGSRRTRGSGRRRAASPDGVSAATVAVACLVFAVAFSTGEDAQAHQKLALIAAAAIPIGIAFKALPRALPVRGAWPFFAGVGLLLGLSCIALAWTSSAERTMTEVARLAGFVSVALIGSLLISRPRWKEAAMGTIAGATSVCVLSLASRVFPDLISVGPLDLGGSRLAYPFGYWNALAAWCAIVAVMLLALSAAGSRRGAGAAALAAMPLVGTCLYLTYSRGAFLAVAGGVAAVFLLTANRRRVAAHALVALIATAAAVAVIEANDEIATGSGGSGGLLVAMTLAAACAGCWWGSRSIRLERLGGRGARSIAAGSARAGAALAVLIVVLVPLAYSLAGSEPVASSATTDATSRLLTLDGNRPAYWAGAVDAFAEQPLRGLGPGTFEFWWATNGDEPELVRDAHSVYVEQLAELGILGLTGAALVAGGLLWLALAPVRTGDRSPLAIALPAGSVALVGYLAIDWIWESNAVMVLGIACAVCGGASVARGVTRSSSRPGRGAMVALAGLGVALAAVQVPSLTSGGRIERSNAALLEGLDDRAATLADEAIDAAPWAASPYVQRASVAAERGDYEAAAAAMRAAIDREDQSFRLWLGLADFEARLGNAEAARAALARGTSLAGEAYRSGTLNTDALERRVGMLEE
jgi:hypothetical protein